MENLTLASAWNACAAKVCIEGEISQSQAIAVGVLLFFFKKHGKVWLHCIYKVDVSIALAWLFS